MILRGLASLVVIGLFALNAMLPKGNDAWLFRTLKRS